MTLILLVGFMYKPKYLSFDFFIELFFLMKKLNEMLGYNLYIKEHINQR